MADEVVRPLDDADSSNKSKRKRNFKIEIVDAESGDSVAKVFTIKDAQKKLSELLGKAVSVYAARMASSRGDVIGGKYKLVRLGKKRASKAASAPVPPGKRKLKIRGRRSGQKTVARPIAESTKEVAPVSVQKVAPVSDFSTGAPSLNMEDFVAGQAKLANQVQELVKTLQAPRENTAPGDREIPRVALPDTVHEGLPTPLGNQTATESDLKKIKDALNTPNVIAGSEDTSSISPTNLSNELEMEASPAGINIFVNDIFLPQYRDAMIRVAQMYETNKNLSADPPDLVSFYNSEMRPLLYTEDAKESYDKFVVPQLERIHEDLKDGRQDSVVSESPTPSVDPVTPITPETSRNETPQEQTLEERISTGQIDRYADSTPVNMAGPPAYDLRRTRAQPDRYSPGDWRSAGNLRKMSGYGMFKQHRMQGSGTIYRDVPVVDDIETGIDERRINQVRQEQQEKINACKPKEGLRKRDGEDYFNEEELAIRKEQDQQAQAVGVAQDAYLDTLAEKVGDELQGEKPQDDAAEETKEETKEEEQEDADGAANGNANGNANGGDGGVAAPGGGNGNANGNANGGQQQQPPAVVTGMNNTVLTVLDTPALLAEFENDYLPAARIAELRGNLYYYMGRPGHYKNMLQERTVNLPYYYHMEQPATSTTLTNNDLTSRGFINCQMIHEKFYFRTDVQEAQEYRLKEYFLLALRKFGEKYPSKSMLTALTDFGFETLLFSEVGSGRSGFYFSDPSKRTPEANEFMPELNNIANPPSGMRYSLQQRTRSDPDNPINIWVCLGREVPLGAWADGATLSRAFKKNIINIYQDLGKLCSYETTLDRAAPETIAQVRSGTYVRAWGAELPSDYYSTRVRNGVDPILLNIGKLRDVVAATTGFNDLVTSMWHYDKIVNQTNKSQLLQTPKAQQFNPSVNANSKVRSMLSGFDFQEIAFINQQGGCFPTLGMEEAQRKAFVNDFVNKPYGESGFKNLGYTKKNYCGLGIGNDQGNLLKEMVLDIVGRYGGNILPYLPSLPAIPWWLQQELQLPAEDTGSLNLEQLKDRFLATGWADGGERRGVTQRGGHPNYQVHEPSIQLSDPVVDDPGQAIQSERPRRGRNRRPNQRGNDSGEMQAGRGLLDTAGLPYPENVPYVQTSMDLEDEYALLAYSRPRQLRYGMKEESSADIQRPFMYRNFRRPNYDSGKRKIPEGGTSLVNVYRPSKSVRSMNVNGLPQMGLERSNQEKLYEFQYGDPRGARFVARDPPQVQQGTMRRFGNSFAQAHRQGKSYDIGAAATPGEDRFEREAREKEETIARFEELPGYVDPDETFDNIMDRPGPEPTRSMDGPIVDGEFQPVQGYDPFASLDPFEVVMQRGNGYHGAGTIPHMRISRGMHNIMRKNVRNRPVGHARKGSANNLLHGEIQDVHYYPQYEQVDKETFMPMIPEQNLQRPLPLGSDPRTYTPRPVDVLK